MTYVELNCSKYKFDHLTVYKLMTGVIELLKSNN